MADQSPATERLTKVLGFDAAKKGAITGEVLGEVLAEIKDERKKEAKTRAKEQITKAMQLREEMHKIKKQFDSQNAKFEKELGKLLSQVEAGINGQPVPEETDEQQQQPQQS